MKRVIVGVDGSEAAAGATLWASRLCEATGASLLVASAWTPREDDTDQSTESARREERTWLLDGCWADLARRPGVEVSARLLEGDARVELPRLVDEEHADLLVIGASSDPDRPSRLARQLLHHAGCAVAVVGLDPAPIERGDIVVGVDGSRASAQALRWAIDVARDSAARVTAVFAHDLLADSSPHPPIDGWPYQNEPAVRAEVAAAHDAAVPLELVRRAGKPEDALCAVAHEVDAAAVVVGTRGRGGFHGLLVGRTAVRCVTRTECTVVVVPH